MPYEEEAVDDDEAAAVVPDGEDKSNGVETRPSGEFE
jgi:hypothetical protein